MPEKECQCEGCVFFGMECQKKNAGVRVVCFLVWNARKRMPV